MVQQIIAMVFKTLKPGTLNTSLNKSFGFTLLELVITVGLILILSTTLFFLLSPTESKAKARDTKLLTDLYAFDASINDYKNENGDYPDLTPPTGVTYQHEITTYELNATLEYYVDKSANDGGNDDDVYELGNKLTIL